MIETAADGLRLLAVPLFAVAAVSDWRYRAIPNMIWGAVAILGLAALALDGIASTGGASWTPVINAAVGFAVVAPAAYVAWGRGMFGGGDAKALMVLALALPVAPVELASSPPAGLFVLTVLLNAVILQVPPTIYAGVLTLTDIRPDAWENMEVPFIIYIFGGVMVAVVYGDLLFTLF